MDPPSLVSKVHAAGGGGVTV